MADEIPIPPVDLSARLSQSPASLRRREQYLARGRHCLEAIERDLPDDWSWSGKSVLDFGCGTGRIIRHLLPRAPDCELWGSEIDEAAIEWDRRHLSPPASFVLNGEAPPLPLPDAKFDLVYALSVFTHLTDQWAAWLLELDRVLAPGGRIISTFMGEAMCGAVAGEPWDEENFGMNVYEAGQDWKLGGPMVLHSPWWIEEHWGRLFTIERLRSRGFLEEGARSEQDDHGFVVLRKKEGRAPSTEELERIDPAERREISALRHDLQHLRAEVASLRARGGGA